jgi:hypothetical protein
VEAEESIARGLGGSSEEAEASTAVALRTLVRPPLIQKRYPLSVPSAAEPSADPEFAKVPLAPDQALVGGRSTRAKPTDDWQSSLRSGEKDALSDSIAEAP